MADAHLAVGALAGDVAGLAALIAGPTAATAAATTVTATAAAVAAATTAPAAAALAATAAEATVAAALFQNQLRCVTATQRQSALHGRGPVLAVTRRMSNSLFRMYSGPLLEIHETTRQACVMQKFQSAADMGTWGGAPLGPVTLTALVRPSSPVSMLNSTSSPSRRLR